MKNTIIVIAILVIAAACGYLIYKNKPVDVEVDWTRVTNFEECAEATGTIMESYPAQCRTPDGRTFVQNIGNELEKTDLITIDSPRPTQSIGSPLTISGKARGNWYFEASFPARLYDANGKQLAVIPVTAQGEWMTTEFVPFKATMTFGTPETPTGTLVLEKDNPSGEAQFDDSLIVPVVFANHVPAGAGAGSTADKMTVKVFFGNSAQGGECEKVVHVTREIPRTSAVGRAAIEELLKGPIGGEVAGGYTTAINSGVKVNSLTISNNTAKIDFNATLDQGVAGSCRVGAIRSQITETLKQFSTVSSVIISVNGRTADILQP